MLICLALLAILLKITFIIQKENKKKKKICRFWESWPNKLPQDKQRPASCATPVLRLQQTRFCWRLWLAKPPWVLGTGCPGLLAPPRSPAREQSCRKTQAGASRCYWHLRLSPTERTRKKSWRGSNLLSSSRFGRWGTPQDCYSFRAVFVSVPLLDCYCYQKEK